MDKSSITRKGKIQKLKKEDEVCNGIRSIGDLPEAILLHILSFLSMKDAVRTSVLSKQWQFLWTSIPNLIFNVFEWCHSNRNVKLFMDFIDRVLLLHSPSSIKVFCLAYVILRCEDLSRFDGWISNVLRHNVQECNLYLGRVDGCSSFWLPQGLFTCDTLVELNLGFLETATLNLPSQIHLPNLKKLFLQNARFPDGYSIQRLFCSPALEILHVNRCNMEEISALSISSPKLKHLAIIEYDYNPLHDFPYDRRCQVMIRDCSLVSLDLSGCIVNQYSTSNVSATFVDISNQAVNRLNKILHGLCAVHELGIDEVAVESNEDGLELISGWSYMPAFRALNTLQLGYFEMIILGKILQSTPYLCTLRLHKGAYSSYDEEVEGILDPVPPCFVSSLKKIIIDRSFLEEGELYVFKTMLKHAIVLEEFIISPNAVFLKEPVRWGNFSKKLMAYPRGSKNCKIIL